MCRTNMGGKRGVLCHITSLPNLGISDAKKFITLLSENGIDAWQMLPINPPDVHGSPYASTSAFAGWKELVESPNHGSMEHDSYWLEDWVLFRIIKSHYQGLPWTEWPVEVRDRHTDALDAWRGSLDFEVELTAQKSFQAGWDELLRFANEKEVSLIGDLPIFVAHDSADVWAHRELFQLDENGMPTVVAGVPPDYFSEEGQKWGTVLYNWEAHRKENWRWWRERFSRVLRLFDSVRIDHFRGFHSAWAIPAEDTNAKNGIWQDGPKDELIQVLIEVAKSEEVIIAEDLGIIPPEVIELRVRNGLRGMGVLQFGFDGDLKTNPNNPVNINGQQVVYTGTHDNNTTLGWWNDSDEGRRTRVKEFLGEGEDIVEGCIRLALECKATMAIIPLQDILGLDSGSRMNKPGTALDNWKWKFTWNDALINKMHWFGHYLNPP